MPHNNAHKPVESTQSRFPLSATLPTRKSHPLRADAGVFTRPCRVLRQNEHGGPFLLALITTSYHSSLGLVEPIPNRITANAVKGAIAYASRSCIVGSHLLPTAMLKLGGYAAFLADRAARSFWVQAEATSRLDPL